MIKTQKKQKPSKYELTLARKNEALKLLKQMESVSRKQDNVLKAWDKAEKNNKQAGRRAVIDNSYSKFYKELDKQSDELYDRYYRHLHKDVNVNKSRVNFCDSKYKNHFVDEKYVNDIYNEKLARLKTSFDKKASKR